MMNVNVNVNEYKTQCYVCHERNYHYYFKRNEYRSLHNINVKSVVLFDANHMPVSSPKDRLPVSLWTQEETSRCLQKRIKEQVLKWFLSDNRVPPRSKRAPLNSPCPITWEIARCK